MADPAVVTRLLREWGEGNETAREQLVPLLYDTLRRLAAKYLARERDAKTLQPTALVHEAYLRLVDGPLPDWQSRGHFYGIAASVMRQILVDHARARLAAKRGGGVIQVDLDHALGVAAHDDADFVALGEALDELERVDPRRSRIIELRYFGGLSQEETARALDVSIATVRRETRLAEAWLHVRMHPS